MLEDLKRMFFRLAGGFVGALFVFGLGFTIMSYACTDHPPTWHTE